ncbi:10457_t:CDS:2 [Funneliformis mosseae]|uniref:10457_t:CDS:1 n=1 Tax=Funneliformis mosseae TaxID=27381 RepID=A0A9N9C4B6_FUNMO|nr:10457_t:CDS:2 [Funneliformis mosseae]
MEIQSIIPNEEPNLWDEDFIMDYFENEGTESIILEEKIELITNQTAESPEALNFDEINVDHKTDDEIDVNLIFLLLINLKDYCGITLDDAINDKSHPSSIEWPNDIYREFIEIIIEYQLSNSCGDRLVKLFNSIKNVDKNLLPKTAKEE